MAQMIYVLSSVLALLTVAGCSARAVRPEAQSIEIVSQAPDKSACNYLGEVVGSQGNWITGDFTSNENLVTGARNELRNAAYESVLR